LRRFVPHRLSIAAVLFGFLPGLAGQPLADSAENSGTPAPDRAAEAFPAGSRGAPMPKELLREGVNWTGLLVQSGTYLGIKHAFRVATEPGTRDMQGSFWKGWGGSVRSLRGWEDQDPFLVNYIGHPLQGSAAGFIWANNDRRYYDVEFGKSKEYWKSRLRATGWNFVYSTQFELGPASEATIGYIQRYYPQFGFVDLVVTPVLGMGWMVMEDALDRFVIRKFEDRVENKYARIMVRGWLNPSRSFANMMGFRAPWVRTSRPGTQRYRGLTYREIYGFEQKKDDGPKPLAAPFETAFLANAQKFSGQSWSNTCVGGGNSTGWRFAPAWQLVINVDGCKMLGLQSVSDHLSGDSIAYAMGPRWTPLAARRVSPYVELLLGGAKLSHEYFTPEERARFEQDRQASPGKPPDWTFYADYRSSHAFQLRAGTGVDLRINPALAWRVASVSYARTWTTPLTGVDYRNSIQFTSGLILRLGTW
jgi:hypothetical protein